MDRKEYNYEPKQKIYLKTPFLDKLDPRWQGPYNIVAVGSTRNTVTILKDGKELKVNIKRIRPSSKGEA